MIEEDFGPTLLGRIRKRLWNLTEYPESGCDAQAAAFFSLAVVVVSTATFVLSTLEEFQVSTSPNQTATTVAAEAGNKSGPPENASLGVNLGWRRERNQIFVSIFHTYNKCNTAPAFMIYILITFLRR